MHQLFVDFMIMQGNISLKKGIMEIFKINIYLKTKEINTFFKSKEIEEMDKMILLDQAYPVEQAKKHIDLKY